MAMQSGACPLRSHKLLFRKQSPLGYRQSTPCTVEVPEQQVCLNCLVPCTSCQGIFLTPTPKRSILAFRVSRCLRLRLRVFKVLTWGLGFTGVQDLVCPQSFNGSGLLYDRLVATPWVSPLPGANQQKCANPLNPKPRWSLMYESSQTSVRPFPANQT